MSLPLLRAVALLKPVVEKVLPERKGFPEHLWSLQRVLQSEELRVQGSGG